MDIKIYLGKSKEEIIQNLGSPFHAPNYPIHFDLWAYQIKSSWFSKKTMLYIEFKNNLVIKTYIRKK